MLDPRNKLGRLRLCADYGIISNQRVKTLEGAASLQLQMAGIVIQLQLEYGSVRRCSTSVAVTI